MIQIKEASKYLGITEEKFLEKALLEKLDRVEREIELENFKKDPNTCNKCGGPNKPPGNICSDCWGRYWKNNNCH